MKNEDQDGSTLKKSYCSINWDNEDFLLARVLCPTCGNDFFVRQIHENKPSSCPYCDAKFDYFEAHHENKGTDTDIKPD